MTTRNRMRGLLQLLLLALAAVVPVTAQTAGPAEISLRRADGQPLSTIELGDRVELEIAIDAGAEQLTGFVVYVSYDTDVFRLLEPSGIRTTEPVAEPFAAGGWLDGVVLLNRIEQQDGVTYLAYGEAAGVQRRTVTGSGVAARFTLEATSRPLGDLTTVSIEASGHSRVSHYTTTAEPGVEQAFGIPLGAATLQITGFRIRSMPDLTVVEGDGVQSVYANLDTFVEQEGATVFWSTSFVNGLNVDVGLDNAVTMNPQGIFGDTTVVFTAAELDEGNSDADTVRVRVLARPRITGLPPTVSFAEDDSSQALALDDFVTDLDTPDSELTWTPTNGSFVHVDIDPATRTAVFSAEPDSFGQVDIQLAVSDTTGLADSIVVRIDVTPVNDSPVVQRLNPVYPRLGEGGNVVVPLSELVVDADDPADSLQILLESEGEVTAQLTADGQGVELTGTATGRGLVRLTAIDRDGERSTGRLVAVVLPPGTTLAPELAPLPVLRFVEGTPGTLDLNTLVSDDAPTSQLSWTAASFDELRPAVSDGVLLVSAATGFTGPAAIGLIVTDQDGNSDSGSLAIEVLPAGEPQRPQITAPAKIGIASGAVAGGSPTMVTLNLDALVADPDNNDDEISWSVTASSGLIAEFDDTARQVHLRATRGLRSVATLTLTATDPDEQSATVAIPVLIVEADGPPMVDEIATVVLDSSEAVGRVDLDELVFDDEDFEAELEWLAETEPGIAVELDPVSHLLRVRRDETAGAQPPSEARVVLTVRDTRGQETSAILNVSLPPVFQLDPIPDLLLYAGGTDTTLVLDDFVASGAPTSALLWTVEPTAQLAASIDDGITRARISSPNGEFIGTETVRFVAFDATGRSRVAPVRVIVRGRGLDPQVRTLPILLIKAGEEDRSIDLDDFVVDDDPDSTLTWSVSQPPDVVMSVDPLTHELSVAPQSIAAGPRTAQLLVRDPAGNSALGILQLQVLRGGEPPVLAPLPQILLPAGGDEQSLSLDLYVSDLDTPDDEIIWTVSAEPGVSARIDQRRLLVSIPAGQQGQRQIVLTAEDPQGNRDEATLVLLIQQDDEPPTFALDARRNELVGDLLDITLRPSEELNGPPTVTLNGASAPVREQEDGSFAVSFAIPPVDAPQSVVVDVAGQDRAGNPGQRRGVIALRRVSMSGGQVVVDGGLATLNVPESAAQPGRLAVVYRLGREDLPSAIDPSGGPFYSVTVDGGGPAANSSTLNLFAGGAITDPTTGIERLNADTGLWEDVPAAADSTTGWLSAPAVLSGVYRLGQVEPDQRRPTSTLMNYPNPFRPADGVTQFEYEVERPGQVRLEIYNTLGQRVRILVQDSFHDVGIWSALWDGTDDSGRQLGSGVYLYQLKAPGATRLQRLLLVK